MALNRGLICLALLSGAAAISVHVTPIEKVIQLIDGMKKEVEKDGRDEAKAYEEFACFCKDTSHKKSKSIQKGNDNINNDSADIGDKTQSKEDKSSELLERKRKQNEHSIELDETNTRCAKEKAEYQAEEADLSKAIQGLEDAIKSMGDSKSASLLSIKETLGKTLAMVEAMSPTKHQKVLALLQVDPNKPGYAFHSDDIIDLCKSILKDYKDNKKDLDDEYDKSSKACTATKASLKKKMKANADAMDTLKKDIQKLAKEIAQHRGDLIIANEQLKDDEQYLKDLTARCEDRANDYDQRSVMRNGEITAMAGALSVLTGKVQSRADQVNERAFIQTPKAPAAPAAVASAVPADAPKKVEKPISLLQELSKSSSFLARNSLSQEARKGSALATLKKEGQRLGSMSLMSLSARMAGDPFMKVKGLIQKLIERMLEESKNEASKKGFCDTELAKAEHDRDARWEEANDLSAELASLEAKEDSLVEEIKDLTQDLKDENKALKETTKERKEEKEANAETLKVAKEGLDAVNEATAILRTFYKQAAKAALVQASPVDEDTSGPGFSGNYKGKQGSSKAIFALLETIASDFDRTLRTTEEAEHSAHRDFVNFQQTSKSSIASKETKKELDEQDLDTTRTSLKTKTEDMQTAVDLLDSALLELEKLKPTCIDTGMSYKERVEKREEEIAALKKAMCQLDEDKVESECQR